MISVISFSIAAFSRACSLFCIQQLALCLRPHFLPFAVQIDGLFVRLRPPAFSSLTRPRCFFDLADDLFVDRHSPPPPLGFPSLEMPHLAPFYYWILAAAAVGGFAAFAELPKPLTRCTRRMLKRQQKSSISFLSRRSSALLTDRSKSSVTDTQRKRSCTIENVIPHQPAEGGSNKVQMLCYCPQVNFSGICTLLEYFCS